MARVYDFDLPYQISGVEDSFGVQELQESGLWDQVPAALQQQMVAGAGLFSDGITVTKDDLDSLPDPVWTWIANRLGLQWHEGS